MSFRAIAAAARNYAELSKFRLSSLVVVSTAGGYMMVAAPGTSLAGLALVSGGTFLCAAAANSFNQVRITWTC